MRRVDLRDVTPGKWQTIDLGERERLGGVEPSPLGPGPGPSFLYLWAFNCYSIENKAESPAFKSRSGFLSAMCLPVIHAGVRACWSSDWYCGMAL